MADEDINPVVLLADPKVNHRVWAACLKWSPVVKKQRVPSHQKHKPHVKSRRLTSLKVTVGSRSSRGKISRITGTGILARPERNHYFSLALAAKEETEVAEHMEYSWKRQFPEALKEELLV